jgi:pimeloyl-ACP methyl ester carboxylesterase
LIRSQVTRRAIVRHASVRYLPPTEYLMSTISVREVSLFVKVIGHGCPLLLMHGGPGVDHTTMLPFRPCADRFRLIFYYHRCNGRSVGAPVESMTWENLTADAEELRRALDFEKCAVLGHSFGGMVALEYVLRYPQGLSHLLLVDTCGDIRWAQQWRNGSQCIFRQEVRTMRIRYFADTDTLHIEFQETPVTETKDLDENTLLDLDSEGNICAITVEHASRRAGIPQFSYEQIAA